MRELLSFKEMVPLFRLNLASITVMIFLAAGVIFVNSIRMTPFSQTICHLRDYGIEFDAVPRYVFGWPMNIGYVIQFRGESHLTMYFAQEIQPYVINATVAFAAIFVAGMIFNSRYP